jgi:beta-glucosidase
MVDKMVDKKDVLMLKRLFTTLAALLLLAGVNVTHGNAAQPVEARVEALLAQMTLAEKIGQMTLIEKDSLAPGDVASHLLGGVLSGGGGSPAVNTAAAWAAMVNGFQAEALTTRLAIPVIYGVDAVHGHGNLYGATVFPHQIGLGATRNPALVEQIGRATAREMIATGIYWNYAPVVAAPQDIRWGRTYEAYSEDIALVTELALAYQRGLQGESLGAPGTVAATPKHYVADGGTTWGSSTTGDYQIDQGDADLNEDTLRGVHLPPYQAAVEAGARVIMVSFSSWNGLKMHANGYLLTEVLKGEYGFTGFVVSDWAGIDQINPDDYAASVVAAINAGVDMNMVPYDAGRFIAALTAAVESGDVPMERIDDAVRRILRVKFELGLFERPFSDPALLVTVGSDEHRALARQAVRESLVLLKNEAETLPIALDTSDEPPTIFVAGGFADDIGVQAGGWTITWQGASGPTIPGTTLLVGIEAAAGDRATVLYDRFGQFARATDAEGAPLIADYAVVVVGETPYAEGVGDRADLSLEASQRVLVQRMRERAERLIVVLIAGRPMIASGELEAADAFVVAWLPGSEGAGVADGLFGLSPFTGRLPFTWPRSMDQLPLPNALDDPLFPLGFGLGLE